MLLDARQGELYLARYRRIQEDVETLLSPWRNDAGAIERITA